MQLLYVLHLYDKNCVSFVDDTEEGELNSWLAKVNQESLTCQWPRSTHCACDHSSTLWIFRQSIILACCSTESRKTRAHGGFLVRVTPP